MKAKDVAMYILGGFVTIGFFVVMIYLIYKGGFEGTLNLLIGALITSFAAVVHYFFGSSRGSADKNDIIAKR